MALSHQLGQRLKQLREELRIPVAEVAGHIGVTPQFLNMIERGDRNTTTAVLEKLAVVYQVDVADLFVFPSAGKLRHHAREIIRLTPNAKLGVLLESMERATGTTCEEVQRLAAAHFPAHQKAASR